MIPMAPYALHGLALLVGASGGVYRSSGQQAPWPAALPAGPPALLSGIHGAARGAVT